MSLVVSRTPYRVSFFGGGTDYTTWYRQHGGAVLSMAIDKYCFITSRFMPSYFPTRHRIVWTHIEVVEAIAEILHPAVRAGLQMLQFDDAAGIEIHHQGDLPARSGIGSSSAFAVGLIKALTALRGTTISTHDLALAAIALEQDHLHDTVGSQDQVAAAYGGLNLIRFRQDGGIEVEPLVLPAERRSAFEQRLMMFYTGSSRLSSGMAKDIVGNLDAKASCLQRMHRMVFEAAAILQSGDLDDFGRMLDETWRLKRDLSASMSNPALDEIYAAARAAGALGGKLLGAGGAGFMAFYVPEGRNTDVQCALRHLIAVPLRIDDTGATLVYQGVPQLS